MENIRNNMEGKSYIKVFFFFLLTIPLSLFLGISVLSFFIYISALLIIGFGFSMFTIQLSTGYVMDRSWKLKWSRENNPTRYWIMLFLSLIMGIWFSLAALLVSSTFL